VRTGLTDSAKEIREKLLAFWDDQARLDYDSVNRLKQTLTFVLTPPGPFRIPSVPVLILFCTDVQYSVLARRGE
jgi:hypothetical protein